MNSYNDNLHAGIVTSLSNQEIELKKLKGQLDASMLSLYYAEGSRITAAEKLKQASDEYESQKNISEQADIDSDISTNVLQSATKAKDLVANTVTNTAVAASNVQVAANAILKLASDTGSIYSIVQAANFGGDIYKQSDEANTLMNDTAYLAESLSQHSMEAAGSIAEVATGILAEKATATDTGVKNLLSVTTTDLTTASDTVTTANEALASTNKLEKEAEGSLETINSLYYASESAYLLNNEELNLELTAKETEDKTSSDRQYTVSFNPYTSAFKGPNTGTKPYPVNAYYVFLVKDAVKKNFSIANAENIVNNDQENTKKQYRKIPATGSTEPYSEPISIKDLKDFNGDDFELGSTYVVFVYGDLSSDYKRIINTFDNYLTAPSPSFSITNHLNPAFDVKVGPKLDDSTPPSPVVPAVQQLTFNVINDLDAKMTYRCIFLPDNKIFTKGLLTAGELSSIAKEQQALQEAENEFAAKLHELEELLSKENKTKDSLKSELEVFLKSLEEEKAANKGKLTAKSKKEKETKTKSVSDSNAEIKKIEAALEKLKAEILSKAIEYSHLTHEIPGFCFDLMIAEKIPAGSYTTVEDLEIPSTPLKPASSSEKTKGTTPTSTEPVIIPVEGVLTLTKAMTDNFGNRLTEGNTYIPVILSMSDDTESINHTITNALSDFKNTPSFTYAG